MNRDKSPGSGHFTGTPEDAANLTKALESGDLERRITSLERRIEDLDRSLLDRHTKTITIIFSSMAGCVAVCAILVTILGLLSKSESRDAAREMKQDAKETMDAMEKRFQALAGESLKRPHILISSGQGPLDGQQFEIPAGAAAPFYPLFLRNEGDKRSDPLSVRLYASAPIMSNDPDWDRVETNDKDYPFSYYFTSHGRTGSIGIAAKETWTMATPVSRLFPVGTNPSACKLLVFYGAESPAEARFVIRFKQ